MCSIDAKGLDGNVLWLRGMRRVMVLLVVLAGCAQAPSREPAPPAKADADSAAAAAAEKDIALFQQAISSLSRADLEHAEVDFREIAARRPEFAGPWVNLALIDIKRKDLSGAEKNLARALEKNPQMPQAYNLLGFIEVSKGNMNKAAEDYQKAISFKEDYAIAHYNFALVCDLYLNDIKTAVHHYKRYLELTNQQDKKTSDWVAELERRQAEGSR